MINDEFYQTPTNNIKKNGRPSPLVHYKGVVISPLP